ncbi:MAG TPA: efflux RND transporter periplasmic adaptor subunit [Stellaceae bacterium]|jgi:multidrug efflux system membrane fusion protein|nr:efflux RND transporter periplasmic adaptor subunit [Stellaceae bacterium]
MRKVVIAVTGGALVAAGVAVGVVPQLRAYVWPEVKAADAPAPAAPAGVPVTAGTVAATDVPVFLNGIGSVQAYNMVTIKTRVDGQITKVRFAEGQEVKAGDPLVQIDPRPYKAAYDLANANLEKDQANLTNAQLNFQRDAAIITSNLAVSRQQYDNDKAAVTVDQALVDGDKAQVELAQTNLDYCDIHAPISGRLGVRLVDAGNIVHANDTTGLVTITQTKPIYVNFTLAQENLHKIHEKQALGDLRVEAYGADNVTLLSVGKLTVIDNAVDQTTGTIRLKGTFDNADERLWPGEFVDVRLILNTKKGAPTVPQQTVQVGPNGYYAYVIKADDTVERRAVEVGSIQDGLAVINKGLQPGEKVVVDGQYRLTEGARVRIAPGASG